MLPSSLLRRRKTLVTLPMMPFCSSSLGSTAGMLALLEAEMRRRERPAAWSAFSGAGENCAVAPGQGLDGPQFQGRRWQPGHRPRSLVNDASQRGAAALPP